MFLLLSCLNDWIIDIDGCNFSPEVFTLKMSVFIVVGRPGQGGSEEACLYYLHTSWPAASSPPIVWIRMAMRCTVCTVFMSAPTLASQQIKDPWSLIVSIHLCWNGGIDIFCLVEDSRRVNLIFFWWGHRRLRFTFSKGHQTRWLAVYLDFKNLMGKLFRLLFFCSSFVTNCWFCLCTDPRHLLSCVSGAFLSLQL